MKLRKRIIAMFTAMMMAVTGMVMTVSATQWDTWSLRYYPGAPSNVNITTQTSQHIYYGAYGDFFTHCSEITSGRKVDIYMLHAIPNSPSIGGYYYLIMASKQITSTGNSKLTTPCEYGETYRIDAVLGNISNSAANEANGDYYY